MAVVAAAVCPWHDSSEVVQWDGSHLVTCATTPEINWGHYIVCVVGGIACMWSG